MGVVTTLQDIRNDIETLAPADVLAEFDWCLERLRAWEAQDRPDLDYRQPPARPCWTCRHRRQDEIGASLAVGIRVQTCKKFVRSPGARDCDPLPCGHAYDTFCGGGDYEPDFWTRALRALRIT